MSTILLVDNDAQTIELNAQKLSSRGYEVLKADSGAQCRHRLSWYTVDLVVLSLPLSDVNGLKLCGEIKDKYRIPVILVSKSTDNRDVVAGLRAGGDDYLSKPYDFEVLAARIEARLRGKDESRRYLCYGALKLDVLWGCGYLKGEDMLLTPREFAVLLRLAANAEAVVTSSELTRKIWHSDSEGSNKALWTLISRLRKKLRSGDSGLEISAVRGSGYMLEKI